MVKKIALIMLIVSGIALFFLLDLSRYLTIQELAANRDRLMLLYRQHRVLFTAAFIAVYTLQGALYLPTAAVLSISAGTIFGLLAGTLWVLIGATAGAVLAFLMARTVFSGWVHARFGKRLSSIDRKIVENGFSYLLFLRLVPIFPFFLVNIACALTSIRLGTYIVGTVVGSIPGTLVYVNAGVGLAYIHRLEDAAGPRVLVGFALLGLFALFPVFYRMVVRRRSV